jgi:hypothetical protein
MVEEESGWRCRLPCDRAGQAGQAGQGRREGEGAENAAWISRANAFCCRPPDDIREGSQGSGRVSAFRSEKRQMVNCSLALRRCLRLRLRLRHTPVTVSSAASAGLPTC